MNSKFKQWTGTPLALLAGLIVGWTFLMRTMLVMMIIAGGIYWFSQRVNAES